MVTERMLGKHDVVGLPLYHEICINRRIVTLGSGQAGVSGLLGFVIVAHQGMFEGWCSTAFR